MILLGKTTRARIQEIKQAITVQIKRKNMHSRNAYDERDKILALIPEDKRDEGMFLIGEFADRMRFLNNASHKLYQLDEELKRQESKRIPWAAK